MEEDKVRYTIKYVLNQLPNMGSATDDLMSIFENTEYVDILETKVGSGLTDFKWNKDAKKLHYFGATIHFTYVIIFFLYKLYIQLRKL